MVLHAAFAFCRDPRHHALCTGVDLPDSAVFNLTLQAGSESMSERAVELPDAHGGSLALRGDTDSTQRDKTGTNPLRLHAKAG